MNLQEFTDFVRTRRATRHFSDAPVETELLTGLLESARWSPSAFNLQPTHYIVVTDQAVKEKLYPACMNQTQVLEAGATVVFPGDRRIYEHDAARILEMELAAGAISADYAALLRKNVPLSFGHSPLGLGWAWKAFAGLVAARFMYIPRLQAVYKRFWLAKQVSMAALTFMYAAHAAGLATCPMEGFSERGVRNALGVPAEHDVFLVVPVGYADNSQLKKTRLPLTDRVHYNGWNGRA